MKTLRMPKKNRVSRTYSVECVIADVDSGGSTRLSANAVYWKDSRREPNLRWRYPQGRQDFTFPGHACTVGEVWPGIFTDENGFYVQTDIRISGIDTPEKRPSTKNKDGSKRSEVSRNNEKKAAAASRQALVDLLRQHNFEFKVLSPEEGKYAGRTVAVCEIGGRDVAEYLIEKGHALPYDGGTKTTVNWDVLDKGLMR